MCACQASPRSSADRHPTSGNAGETAADLGNRWTGARRIRIHSFLVMKTLAGSQSSALLGVAYAAGAATVFSTAGVIVRRIDLPAWDVSFWRSTFLVASMLPLLVLQWRGALSDVRHAGPALFLSALLLARAFVAFILALGLAPLANV